MDIKLEQADEWCNSIILPALRDYCEPGMIQVAGSIRRRRPIVHDIDLVAVPKDRASFIARLKRNAKVVMDGNINLILEFGNGVQLDVFLAKPTDKDMFDTQPGNFGALLLCRTGSKAFNVWLCARAAETGFHWNPYWGLFRRGICYASESEEQIFRTLDLDYIKPEDRER